MPLGAPRVVGPVSPCSSELQVQGQFSNSQVRIFVEGDPNPVGEAMVPWSNWRVTVDPNRLVPGKRVAATQRVGSQTSPSPPDWNLGALIVPAKNETVSFVTPLHTCGRSALILDCCPGARVELWQGSTFLGDTIALGHRARIDVLGAGYFVGTSPLTARQYICTSPTAKDSQSPKLTASPVPIGTKLPPPALKGPVEECQRLVTINQIVPGATVRFFRGSQVWERPCPVDSEDFLVSNLTTGEQLAAEQHLPNCGRHSPSARVSLTVTQLLTLLRPKIDGPLCEHGSWIQVSRLKEGATVRLLANGTEIGRWEAYATTCEFPVVVPEATKVIKAQQTLCGVVSPESRPYRAARQGQGRWFVVEDAQGNRLEAKAFAVHAALVRTGKILYFAGNQNDPAQAAEPPRRPAIADHTELFDCATFTIQKIDSPAFDAFCSGQTFLHDGRLLVAGGTQAAGDPARVHTHQAPGAREAALFDPAPPPGAKHWTAAPPMQGGRWYPTLVTLRTARALVLSGHPEREDHQRHTNNTMEVFLPGSAPTWQNLGQSTDIDTTEPKYFYPRLYSIPGGAVFSATPMRNGKSKRWTPSAGTSWTDVAPGGPFPYDGFWSTSVLLPLMPDDDYRARVLQCGGKKAVLLDFAGGPLEWKELDPRSNAAAGRQRLHANAVLLPTAEVFVCGGVEDEKKDSTAVHDPELLVRRWSAERQEWVWRWSNRPLAPTTVPRNYHSTALLMPDGRVWTAGSNINSGFGAHNPPSRRVRRLEIEIYEPWYYCAERPIIREWPSSVRAGQRIVVRVKSGPPVTSLAIIRAGSVTHSFNGDQRYVGLADFTRTGDVCVARVPAAHLAIPGYYLLVACTDRNVPSVGQFMQVRP